jgi:hypothetical protein
MACFEQIVLTLAFMITVVIPTSEEDPCTHAGCWNYTLNGSISDKATFNPLWILGVWCFNFSLESALSYKSAGHCNNQE